MDVRNVDSRLQHLPYGPQLPPGPNWDGAVRNRPPMEEAAPPPTKPAPEATVGPHAAPAERQITLSQQSVAEALRELKLPETPQNVMIAQSLAQMDQPVSAQNMNLVRNALRGLAVAGADDVAAAVVLLMNDLPVSPAGIAAIRQLMNGPSLPDQLHRLGNQLTALLGQLDATGQQLATLGLPNTVAGQPPAPGTVPGMPLNVMPAAAQAAAAATAQAAAVEAAVEGVDSETSSSGDGDEGGSVGESDGPSGPSKGSSTGGGGSVASLTGTGNRRENAPISRALGGAIGRMTSDQTEGVGTTAPGDGTPETDQTAPQPRQSDTPDPQGRPSAGGQSARQGSQPGSKQPPTLEQLAANQTSTTPKLNIGGRSGMPDAPLPPGFGTPGTAPGSGQAPAGSQGGSGSPGQGGAGSGAPQPGQTSGNPGRDAGAAPTGRLNVGASADTARPPGASVPATAAGTGKVPPPAEGMAKGMAPAMQILRSADLATTVREPAYLPQQVAALKTVFRELPGALLNLEKDVRAFASDPRPVEDIPLPELESLLEKAVGHRAGAELDAHDEGVLRQLFDDLRKAMAATSGSLHETLGNLHAREQLTQASNVLCLPLALPGPPPRPVELMVEGDPEEDHHRRQGGSPVHMRLSIDTHHLGRVGIDVVAWQEKLSIKLQVTNPAIQALVTEHLAHLDKALARGGFVTPDLAVAVAPVEQRASMLLPERKYTRSLRRIEGII